MPNQFLLYLIFNIHVVGRCKPQQKQVTACPVCCCGCRRQAGHSDVRLDLVVQLCGEWLLKK